MNGQPPHVITRLLESARGGDGAAVDQLWALIYEELHRMAAGRLASNPGDRTLQPTALVNEAYLRLMGNGKVPFQNRRHFFVAAARAMHQIIVDDVRRRGRKKRGGLKRAVCLNEGDAAVEEDPTFVLDIDEALKRMGEQRPDLVEIVQLRYFVGMGLDETAEVLGVARKTVANRWKVAKALLAGMLDDGDE
ncbi:MAG: RNA polymerase subunit sigma [Phycisphaerales bacterium]|nr:RNA polymerase subunit sigma [Phycisphaerales bacterium]